MTNATAPLPSAPLTPSVEPPASPATGPAAAPRAARIAILLTLAIALLGLFVRGMVEDVGLGEPLVSSTNIFYRLFVLHEQLPLLLLAAFCAIALVVSRREATSAPSAMPRFAAPAWLCSRRGALVAALGVLAVTWAGTFLVMHGFALSMDEYNAEFQARIFLGGHTAAEVPAAWRQWVDAMLPVFTAYKPAQHVWLSLYLPVYAGIRAAFIALHAESLANPLMAAISVVALAGAARRLWPADRERPVIAVALLATSAQFLVTAMSAYSMPAHLCLNLVWLWLYLRDDRPAILLLPLVGVAAMGLHNPFPHALFVAPFLLRRLRERRWGTLAWLATVYGVGSLGWLLQLRALRAGLDAQGMTGAFALPTLGSIWTQLSNLALLADWQTPVMAIGAGAALLSWRRLEPAVRDVALGLLLTLAFYCFFPANQGHGWGYRYAHAVLGNFVLLATAGLAVLADAMGRTRAARLTMASLAVSLVMQLPMRFVQTERFVRPFAAASAWVESRPEAIVLVPTRSMWYGRDLVRNDPYLRAGPKVLAIGGLPPGGLDVLRREHPGQVLIVTPADLMRFGMEMTVMPGRR